MNEEPDLYLCGLSLWVDRRQFPNATDYWDSNWLMIRVTMKDVGAYIECSGPILRTDDVEHFREGLVAMHTTLTGEAVLKSLEPGIVVSLKMDRLGRAVGMIEITPDHLNQEHRFMVGFDQSYLPGLISACAAILGEFPVLDASNERA